VNPSEAIEFARSERTTGGQSTQLALLALADEVQRLERENAALRAENETLHDDFVNANGRCDMQMKEIARLKAALNTALGIEYLDEEILEELIKRLRQIIKEQ